MNVENPYLHTDGKWYWYDETGMDTGPFDTREQADAELQAYFRWLDHGPEATV